MSENDASGIYPLLPEQPQWIQDMVRHFFPYDHTNADIPNGSMVAAKNRPERLYKYKSLKDINEIERTMQQIKDETFVAVSPRMFNDPYDCMASFFESIEGKLRQTQGETYSHILNFLESSARTLQDTIRVCSFSEDYDNQLMWSHYADDHRGLCVEYVAGYHTSILPVIYREEFIDIAPYLKSGDEESWSHVIALLTLLKGLDWKYEKEWRRIQILEDNTSPYIDHLPISAVYLGARAPSIVFDMITDLARNKKFNVYRMHVSPSRYKMERREVFSPLTSS